MTATKNDQNLLTQEEIKELRALVDAGIRSVSTTNLEELERLSGPLKPSEIYFYAVIGAARKHTGDETS